MLSGFLLTCALAVNGFFDNDTTPHKWYIGYDQGLSVRYFPASPYGIGVLVQPEGNYLFNDSENKRQYSYNLSSSSNQKNTTEENFKNKGVSVHFEGYFKKQLNSVFTITPFVNIGGRYETGREEYRQSTINTFLDTMYSHYENVNTYTKRSFSGALGIMPGMRFGRFLVEFRLGLSGEISKQESPETNRNSSSGTSKKVMLVYPSNLVQALVIHINL